MRRNLLLLFALATAFLHAQQTIVWEEDFNTEDISAWTLINADGATAPWGDVTWDTHQFLDANFQPIDTPFLFNSSFTMYDDWGHQNPDDWAITPAIDLTAIPNGENIELSWAMVFQPNTMTPFPNGENYSVYIATSNSAEAMLVGGVKYNESNIPVVYTTRNLNISEYAGQIIYIGFRQHDVDNSITPALMSGIGIDDVTIKKGTMLGCLTATFGQYPQAVYTPSCIGSKEIITPDGITGEYSAVNVTGGVNYTFSTSNETTFITIGNENGTQILASGTGSVTWVSNVTGLIRFYTHLSSACDANFNQFERAVQCGVYIPGCEENTVSTEAVEDYFILGGTTNQRLAIDVLTPSSGFTLYGMKPLLAGNATTFSFNIYQDAWGSPGEQIDTKTGILASQTPIGEYIEYEIAFSSPLQLDANTTYWIEIITDAQGWGYTSNPEYIINKNSAGNNDQTLGLWQIMSGFELIYSLVCEEIELGVSDFNSFEFSYYPNPVNDVLNISSKAAIKEISVFNVTGQKVLNSNKINSGKIDVSNLNAGIYVFRVQLENGQIETFKIVKK